MKHKKLIPSAPPENIFDAILSIMNRLPKKQKKLCTYIIESYQSVGLLTVKELAETAGVGTTTVMRLVQLLGFNSYISMRKAIHKMSMQTAPNTWSTMEQSFKTGNLDNNEMSVTQVWKEIEFVLGRTFNDRLQANISKLVDLLLESHVIHVLGLRSSRPIADYFHYLLEEFYPKTNQLSFDTEVIFDRILRFKLDEVLFVTTFHPYSNKTIEAAQYCHNRGNKVVLLTDSLTCPIAQYADIVLQTESSRYQYSIVPAIAVLESIVIELGRRTSDTSIQSLKELDAVLKDRKINYWSY